MKVTIKHRGQTRVADEVTWQAAADEMVRDLGAWVPGESCIIKHNGCCDAEKPTTPKRNSDFGDGKQVVDSQAKDRIEATHKALADAGVTVDTDRQLFATGTRMADSGYATQAARAIEHGSKHKASEAAAELVERIKAERRKDVEVTAGDLGRKLTMNSALTFDGLKLREQAIRGVLGRMQSPALRYVLGLRDRIADRGPDAGTEAQKAMDKAALLDVLQRECKRFADVSLKLRTRAGLGDVFAAVSPDYAPADAPEVLADVLASLPSDAKASYSYDPTSTTWELRASVWTPTPVDEQAVGEPFEGFVSFSSRDNGTRRLGGGGGILILACLNASTYQADATDVSRVHRGAILRDLRNMAHQATKAIHTLCAAWGTARVEVVEVPARITIEQAVPGFYRGMLTSRKGELVGVLPGRTEHHVIGLAKHYNDQKRDPNNVTRADLAQGFTSYIHGQAAPVQRDAESAIARWVVGRERVEYTAQ